MVIRYEDGKELEKILKTHLNDLEFIGKIIKPQKPQKMNFNKSVTQILNQPK